MANPTSELVLQLGTKETWKGDTVTVATGGAIDLQILDSAQHLINLLETYGEAAFWGIVDIEIVPLAANAAVWHVSAPALIEIDGVNVGVQFTLSNGAGANGNTTYFVKVRVPHTKTN